MKKTLYVFTSSYPFGNTDAPFLTRELEYLEKHFSEVILVPRTADLKKSLITNKYKIDTSLLNYRHSTKLIKYLANTHILSEVLTMIFRFRIDRLRKLWWTLTTAANLAEWALNNIDKDSPCLLYSYWFSSTAVGLALARYKGLTHPIVSRAHRGDLYDERTSLGYFPLRLFTLGYIDRLFLISEDGLSYISKKYPKFQEKYELSRLGVEAPSIQTLPSHEPQTLSIVSCAYLRPVKRIIFLCEILFTLGKLHPGWMITWNHFGGGETQEIENLIEKVKSSPDNLKVTLWGSVPNERIIEFYEKSEVDFLISVSSSEGIPVSMMEALSYGIPIIATDVGGVHELVNQENGCLLSKEVSIEQAVYSIMDFVRKNIHKSRRRSARDTWHEKFNAEKNYSMFSSKLSDISIFFDNDC